MTAVPTLNAATALSMAQALAADFATRAAAADQAGALPAADIAALRNSGYLTLSVPAEYGGAGLSLLDCVAAHVALAKGSASTALVAGMQIHIFGHARETHPWPVERWAQLCRLAVEEDALFNSISSEPALGSPSRGRFFQTTAVPHDGGWHLNGHKTWSSGGRHLTHLLVSCNVGDAPGQLLVPATTPGIRWVDTWGDALSLRASDSHDVHFENVWLPDENVLSRGARSGGPNLWFPLIMSAVYLGAALAARDAAIEYTLERVPTALGRPIATLPKIQRQIGEIDLALQAAEALLYAVAAQWDDVDGDRDAHFPHIAAAKTLVTETANDVTDRALRIAGGAGITRGLPLERHFRDVRAGLMQPPSGDGALELIGRHAIGPLADGGA